MILDFGKTVGFRFTRLENKRRIDRGIPAPVTTHRYDAGDGQPGNQSKQKPPIWTDNSSFSQIAARRRQLTGWAFHELLLSQVIVDRFARQRREDGGQEIMGIHLPVLDFPV